MTQFYSDRSNCIRGAKRALKKAGVADPVMGEHFEVHAVKGGFEWIDVRPNGAENDPSPVALARVDEVAARHTAETLEALEEIGAGMTQGPETAPQEATPAEGTVAAPVEPEASGEAESEASDAFDEPAKVAVPMAPAVYGLAGDIEALIMGLAVARREARAAAEPHKEPRRVGMLAEVEAAVKAGEWPLPKFLVSSMANAHVQTHVNRLYASAEAGDRAGVEGYPIKGTNTYSKALRRLQGLLLTAMDARQPASAAAVA